MRYTTLALILALVGIPSAAEARPPRARPPAWRVVVPAPRVRVYVGPWAVGYVPAPRAGWVWVPGHYTASSRWMPGHWRPASTRPGWAWVPGYWVGDEYVDGYWRESARPGAAWVDGYYNEDGQWVSGYWAPANSADARRDAEQGAPPSEPPPEPPTEGGDVHHDYE